MNFPPFFYQNSFLLFVFLLSFLLIALLAYQFLKKTRFVGSHRRMAYLYTCTDLLFIAVKNDFIQCSHIHIDCIYLFVACDNHLISQNIFILVFSYKHKHSVVCLNSL